MAAPLVLVTGASGLLGGCLIDRLRARVTSTSARSSAPFPVSTIVAAGRSTSASQSAAKFSVGQRLRGMR